MQLQIKTITKDNVPSLVRLLSEFADFEGLKHELLVTEEKLHEVIFGENAFVQCLVGFAGQEMVAYAIFFPKFNTFRGDRSIYLEDLYVKQEHRGKGFGLEMLKAVAKYASENGYARMDWQALNWNKPAIDFYNKLGAESDDTNLNFRLIGEAFEKLSE